MDTDLFRCEFCIESVYWQRPPSVTVFLDDAVLWQGQVNRCLDLEIDKTMVRGSHVLGIEFWGKQNSDCQGGFDQAVMINRVGFFGISDPKFKWQAVYEPKYPEPWYSEQLAKGIALPNRLTAHDYLGWNGTWRLEFSTPIFTWMHGVLDLGWVYS